MEWIWKVFRVAICIININTSLWFLDNVLIEDYYGRYKKRFIFIIIIFLIIVLGQETTALIAIIWYNVVLFVYAIYIKAKINLLNIFLIIQSVSNCLAIFFLAYVLGALLNHYTFIEYYYDNSLLRQGTFLFIVIFRRAVLKKQIEQKSIIENLSKRQLLISILVFIIIQVFFIYTLKSNILINEPVTAFNVFLIILLFGVNAFFSKILDFLSQEIEEKYFLEMSIKQNELEERYIKEISQMYYDIKAWKHDYRNNMNVICNLAIANKKEELFKYIEEVDKEIKITEAMIYTGFFLIDSVITSKYVYGTTKGINFNIKASKIEKGNISDFDINIILSNLLDNAIEGALKSEEKKIEIDIFEKNNNMIFRIKNTFDGNIKRINGKYITTKGGSSHGLGINRIKRTVDKYNGYFCMSNDNNVFESKVIIGIK